MSEVVGSGSGCPLEGVGSGSTPCGGSCSEWVGCISELPEGSCSERVDSALQGKCVDVLQGKSTHKWP